MADDASGVVRATGCGANQASCADEFAIVALATSPYDCQAKVVPTPRANMMRNRVRARVARLPSDGRIMAASRDDRLIASTLDPAALGCVGNSDCVGLNVGSIEAPPCLLRPVSHCSSSHPNSASSASKVGRSEGDSNCFICTVATPYWNPKLLGQWWRAELTGSRRTEKRTMKNVDFSLDRDI